MSIHTQYWQVDTHMPQTDIIHRAADFIKEGQLVAFPTETVYGLGAGAFQPAAVNKIFSAKGRPTNNPLLVHVSNQDQVKQLVDHLTPVAQRLMQHFWPGPLSIILPAASSVPMVVRGGKPGVGLRMPSHPVALALIDAAGPLAAPSANRYGRPSPTNAEHVRQDLDGKIAAVLDAGDIGAGLESTLIDLTDFKYRILRRGGISVELIEECVGCSIEVALGQSLSGYKVDVKIILSADTADFHEKVEKAVACGRNIGVVNMDSKHIRGINSSIRSFILDSAGEGAGLYNIIREAEAGGIEILVFAPIEPDKVGEAWRDRLCRAAAE